MRGPFLMLPCHLVPIKSSAPTAVCPGHDLFLFTLYHTTMAAARKFLVTLDVGIGRDIKGKMSLRSSGIGVRGPSNAGVGPARAPVTDESEDDDPSPDFLVSHS